MQESESLKHESERLQRETLDLGRKATAHIRLGTALESLKADDETLCLLAQCQESVNKVAHKLENGNRASAITKMIPKRTVVAHKVYIRGRCGDCRSEKAPDEQPKSTDQRCEFIFECDCCGKVYRKIEAPEAAAAGPAEDRER